MGECTGLLYKDIKVGQKLLITGLDAVSNKPNVLKVEIVALYYKPLEEVPIFRFLEGDFSLYGPDRKLPVVPRIGALAYGGCSARHLPTFGRPVYMGKMALNLDYGFKNYDGGPHSLYIAGIQRIGIIPPPCGWSAPKGELDQFAIRVDGLHKTPQAIRREKIRRRMRNYVIRTDTGTYSLTPGNEEEGVYHLQKEGDSSVHRGKLVSSVAIGSSMIFVKEDGEKEESIRGGKIESILEE